MGDWISDVLLFSAGIAGGILITMIVSFFRVDKGRRPDLAVTRARVLADLTLRRLGVSGACGR